jgi:hypothetical protein
MSVYILIHGWSYEDDEVLGVFNSLDKAQAALFEKRGYEYGINSLRIETWQVE